MGNPEFVLPTGPVARPVSKSRWPLVVLSAILGCLVLFSNTPACLKGRSHAHPLAGAVRGGGCYQPKATLPEGHNLTEVWNHREQIIQWLSGAVKIPTEVFDEMGPVDSDPKWKTMGTFQDYLEEQFPLVHSTLNKTVVDWALIYEYPGSDPSLKPLFLTAHQDVVPVLPSTLDQWDQPPYSGYYDGTYVWGRGSSDTKSSLIAIMASLELLLKSSPDWAPKRTIILGFGSDEERGGQVGAPAIARYLLEKHGKDSMAMLIDEGSENINIWGQQFALPAVAEKGHYDLGITVETLGGHSSVPPAHTAIGYVASLIAQLEAHPHEVYLEETSPVYGFMTCAAEYADEIPRKLKHAVAKSKKGKKAWDEMVKEIINVGVQPKVAGPGQGNIMEMLMKTSQATDVINGGLKVNALPETVTAVVNHRINIPSNHLELEAHIIKTLLSTVKHFNLTLIDFSNKTIHHGHPTSKVILSNAYGYYTEPAPISPTDASKKDSPYNILAATARGVWASRKEVSTDGQIVELDQGKDLVMAPFMSTGNTDTRRYWDLTDNIYRYRYSQSEHAFGAHTINERTGADDVVEFTRWYQAIILAMDQTTSVA